MKKLIKSLFFVTLTLGLGLKLGAMEQKTLQNLNFSLFEHCVKMESDFAPGLKVSGNYNEVMAKLEAYNAQRENERMPLIEALKHHGDRVNFVVQGKYNRQDLKIRFQLQLLANSNIELNNLEVFNVGVEPPKNIAFSMLPRKGALLVGGANNIKFSTSSAGPIICPYFKSFIVSDSGHQDDIVTSNAEHLDLFKIAIIMLNAQ